VRDARGSPKIQDDVRTLEGQVWGKGGFEITKGWLRSHQWRSKVTEAKEEELIKSFLIVRASPPRRMGRTGGCLRGCYAECR